MDTEPNLRDWIGRQEVTRDSIGPLRARAMAALLDREESFAVGASLPPLWHWLYFWNLSPQAALDRDGHMARGGFLPPVGLPRRMWAGSRISFQRPLLIGSEAERQSTLIDIVEKRGRSGRLVFVTVRHEVLVGGDCCIDEEHDIVYRGLPEGGGTGTATLRSETEESPAEPAWRWEIQPDPVLLFRYSALTFNSHRIHYDADYVRDVEGYPGLIVHGPLLATLMVELARRERPKARISEFSFRALSPIFDGAPFTVAGAPDDDVEGAEVWIAGPAGETAMQGRVELA